MARFRGTGKDERGRYPAGQLVDVDEEAAEGLLERGWIEAVQAAASPAHQLAASVVRNDLLSDPVDREAAREAGFLDDDGAPTPAAFRVAGDEPAEEAGTAPTRRRRAGG